MIFHENFLPADNSHEYHALFVNFEKGALRVKVGLQLFHIKWLSTDWPKTHFNKCKKLKIFFELSTCFMKRSLLIFKKT